MNEKTQRLKKGRRYNVVPEERSDFHLSLSPAPDFNAAVRAPHMSRARRVPAFFDSGTPFCEQRHRVLIEFGPFFVRHAGCGLDR